MTRRSMAIRRAVALTALAALAAGAAPLHAQSRGTVVPSVAIGTVYDDNVNARANGDAGKMLQIRPSLEADYESPKVTLISLWSFDMQRSNHSSLNALDARRHAMLDSKFKPTAFTTFGLLARYDHSDTPGDIDFETGVLTRRQNAQRYEVVPALFHRAGARTTVSASYNWSTEHLDFHGTQTMHQGRTGVSRQVSTRSSVDVGYVGRLFPENRLGPFADVYDRHQSHAVLLGWTQRLGQFTTLTLQAGPRTTTYRGMAAEIVAALNRDGHRAKWGVDYWRGETIILGVEGPVEIDTANARVTWVATRRVEFGLRTGASHIITLDDRAATTYRGTVVGSWTMGGPFTVSASYSADYQLGDIRRNFFADDQVLRHVFRVGLTIAPRFSRSFLPADEAARAKGVSR